MRKAFVILAVLAVSAFSAVLACPSVSLQKPIAEELYDSGLGFGRVTSDNRFERPLAEVLDDLQQRFNVQFKIKKQLTEGVQVTYSYARICPWSLEQSLNKVLGPLDYTWEEVTSGVYEIKRFENHRRSVADAKAYLDYLAGQYDDRASWEKRRDSLRIALRHNAGLDNLPQTFASRPYLTDKRAYGSYYVQNFALEILPGVYCTGSLYHPLKSRASVKDRLCPVVLNPNGHFGDGRYNADIQKRCAMQAQMGCIAVNYDLFAWGEQALQFEASSHRTSAAHTIQCLNSLRLLDWLLTLKEADPSRVAITGGSGGGSATMFITAIDERITLSMPVVMTSAIHYGGCPCESGNPTHASCGGTNNVEIAAMCAPRPLLVVSDGKDWTANVPSLEFPFIERIYGFYEASGVAGGGSGVASVASGVAGGGSGVVENAHFPSEGHDYGPSKRQATYAFLLKHWKLDASKLILPDGTLDESGCVVEDENTMKIWGVKGEKLPSDALHGIDNLYKLLNNYYNR